MPMQCLCFVHYFAELLFMRKNFRNFSLLGVLLLLQKADCFGGGAPEVEHSSITNEMSIELLVAEGLAKNPELNFYLSEIAAAKAGLRTAALWRNPELNGSIGHKTARERSSGLSAEGVTWSVSVLQPFEWPGRIALRKAIANRDVELAELGYERFRVALAGRIRLLAYNVMAAQDKSAVAREVAERFRSLREVLLQRDPTGLTPLLETRVIEAAEVTLQRKASESEIAAKRAVLELNQLRGEKPETALAVSRTGLKFRASEPKAKLIALARTNNFELRVREVEIAQQGFKVALARNERFPTVSVGPTVTEERAFERERIIGVGVSLPLPLWNRNNSNIEAAQTRRLQAETSLLITERETERKVLEAAMTYEGRLSEMQKWRPDSVEHFREAAELADRHYRLGAVPVSTYVELQKQYLEAVESLLDTKRETLEAGQNLELLTGLTPSLVSAAQEEEKE
jgi:cobalt-zinc-cadmium efflux system outer membrane protein